MLLKAVFYKNNFKVSYVNLKNKKQFLYNLFYKHSKANFKAALQVKKATFLALLK